MAKVRMQALKVWTGNGHDAAILHFDPNGSDPRARIPEVDEEDVARLEAAGIAKRLGSNTPAIGPVPDAPTRTIQELASERLERTADAEESVDVTTALSQRSTIAFPQDVEAGQAADGQPAPVEPAVAPASDAASSADGLSDDDPDAPPAPKAPEPKVGETPVVKPATAKPAAAAKPASAPKATEPKGDGSKAGDDKK